MAAERKFAPAAAHNMECELEKVQTSVDNAKHELDRPTLDSSPQPLATDHRTGDPARLRASSLLRSATTSPSGRWPSRLAEDQRRERTMKVLLIGASGAIGPGLCRS
jgi:hypothetical protein